MRADRTVSPGGERGSAVVEFALVLPLLLVVALSLVQVGLVARDQLLVTQASRAGAREAAVTPDASSVEAAARAAASGLDPDGMDIAVSRTGGRGQPVTVTVDYAASIRVPFVGWLFPPTVSLSGDATMRQEFS